MFPVICTLLDPVLPLLKLRRKASVLETQSTVVAADGLPGEAPNPEGKQGPEF